MTQPDGKLLVGGYFSTVNGVARPRLARLNADGFVDTAFNAMIGGSFITAIALRPDGKIIIAGGISTVGGVARPGLAQLHPDGTLDTSFVPASSDAGKTLALQADGKLFVGGGQINVGGVLHHGVVRLNPDGSNDAELRSFFDGVKARGRESLSAKEFRSVSLSPPRACSAGRPRNHGRTRNPTYAASRC